jgi:hypothetical protein
VTAAAAGEEVVPASEYRALRRQLCELLRLLRNKVLQIELLRKVVPRTAGAEKLLLRSTLFSGEGQWARWQRRSTKLARIFPRCATDRRRNRKDDHRCRGPNWSPTSACPWLFPTYGDCYIHTLLLRQAEKFGRARRNAKRVHPVDIIPQLLGLHERGIIMTKVTIEVKVRTILHAIGSASPP